MKHLVSLILTVVLVSSCNSNGWTKYEKSLIENSPNVMYVLSIDNDSDQAILRNTSRDLPISELQGELFGLLAEKMIATVTDPSQDGVGIAAPQVGINRRIVAVQRIDKEGEPFEIYPNIKIIEKRGETVCGQEGCLSIPNRRGNVPRSRDIDIQYTSLFSYQDTVETIQGFTAVIFQHECDHLDGVIYTDRIWDEPTSWYSEINPVNPDFVDVFYLFSTNVISSFDNSGNEIFNAVYTEEDMANINHELASAQKKMFPDSLNYFAPYYHQATMNSFFLSEDESTQYFEKAKLEAFDAFDYYMEHYNNGRRFVLAGFSQGAHIILDLLKHISDEQYSQMVAAYLIGQGVNASDIQHPHIVPAKDSLDTGVVISYNSVNDVSSIWDITYNNSVICINPVNWAIDTTPATLSYKDQTFTVSLDTAYHVLVVPEYVDPETPLFWPEGCLHRRDYQFYTECIRKNILDRAYQK